MKRDRAFDEALSAAERGVEEVRVELQVDRRLQQRKQPEETAGTSQSVTGYLRVPILIQPPKSHLPDDSEEPEIDLGQESSSGTKTPVEAQAITLTNAQEPVEPCGTNDMTEDIAPGAEDEGHESPVPPILKRDSTQDTTRSSFFPTQASGDAGAAPA